MKKKNKEKVDKNTTEEIQDQVAEEQEPVSAEGESQEQEAARQLRESQDKFTRLFAEFDNYKKRTARERLELMSTANMEVLQSMLPILDDFDRALKACEDEASREGFTLVLNKLKTTLKAKGLEEVGTQAGDDFDVDKHEAITTIPAPAEDQKGKVVDVIEKGYKLGDKVIRYTKVVIGE